METIGDKIKRLRKSKGLSLKDLVKILNISGKNFSDTALSKIETGLTKNITVALGKELSKALDISFNELFEIESSIGNTELIEKQTADIESLKKQIEEKTLLIDALKNEKAHIKEHLVMQMVASYSWDINFIDSQIKYYAKKQDEKEALEINKLNIQRNFDINKDYYIKTGFLSQSDFDDHYMEMQKTFGKDIYKKMTEP